MQTKQFHVIPNTLFPCLPTPSPTSRPLYHQPSASRHPSKCKEMIIRRPKLSANDLIIPPPLSGIPRVDMLKVLGVSFTDKLDFTPHFSGVLGQSSSNLFALRTLRAHGLEGSELAQVTRATVISKIMYASSSWWGFAGAEMRHRLQALIHRCKKLCFLPPDFPTLEELIIEQDTSFFNQILSDRHHVLHHLLPPEKVTGHDLRPDAMAGNYLEQIRECVKLSYTECYT